MKLGISGLDSNKKVLALLHKRIENMTPVLKVIQQDITAVIFESFNKATSPTGKRWAPLAPATLKARAQWNRKKSKAKANNKGWGIQPLARGGDLRRGIFAAIKGKDSIEYGTRVDYGGPHQFGSKKKPGRPPQRQFLPMASDMTGPSFAMRQRAKRLVARYILTGQLGG